MKSVHPRTRGDDFPRTPDGLSSSGSPPHARGRRSRRCSLGSLLRFTPARAGTTSSAGFSSRQFPVHPRTRGDDAGLEALRCAEAGSPPHARGRLRPPGPRRPREPSVHPRTRGDDAPARCCAPDCLRFTPARAGTTHTDSSTLRRFLPTKGPSGRAGSSGGRFTLIWDPWRRTPHTSTRLFGQAPSSGRRTRRSPSLSNIERLVSPCVSTTKPCSFCAR